MGTIDTTRSDLCKVLLVACDLSYSGGDARGQPGQPLAPFADSGPPDHGNADMPISWSPLLGGWEVLRRVDIPETGFGYTVFNKADSDGKISYIVAMQGTRGPNYQDWSGNLIYGWDKWGGPAGQGVALIESLVELTTQENAGSIHFTGQSLGGALAEYALYDFARARNAANLADSTKAAFDPTKVTLTTFNGLGSIEALQKDPVRNFNANASIVSAVDTTHFWITNDIVHRLGGGHLNGAENEYELKFYKTDAAGNIGIIRGQSTDIFASRTSLVMQTSITNDEWFTSSVVQD